MTVICNNVTKQYGGKKALQDVTVHFKENSITGLIGRNGAGKTTLLQMVAGYTLPTQGEVKVFGQDPFNNLNVSANTIFIDDQMVFPPELTLGEILKSAKSFYEKWDEELAQRLVTYFSINLNSYHSNLSKGMRSTFNAIVGLAAKCSLTILDEPTTGMDYSVRQDFYRALLKDYLNHPRTIVVSSHLLNEIEDILEEIVLIKQGELCIHDTVENLKEFAIGLTGTKEKITHWTSGKEIITRKNLGSTEYVVVKADYTDRDKDEMTIMGIQLSKVETTDLCVYLTSPAKGGIDDVFNKN